MAESAFQSTRLQVLDIVRDWVATAEGPTILVSRQGLEKWLSEYCMSSMLQQLKGVVASGNKESLGEVMNVDPSPTIIDIEEDILCEEHQLLCPDKAGDMKCISKVCPHFL